VCSAYRKHTHPIVERSLAVAETRGWRGSSRVSSQVRVKRQRQIGQIATWQAVTPSVFPWAQMVQPGLHRPIVAMWRQPGAFVPAKHSIVVTQSSSSTVVYRLVHRSTYHSGLFTRPSARAHSTLTLQGSPGSGSTQVSPSPSIPYGQDFGQGPPQSMPASPPFISVQQRCGLSACKLVCLLAPRR
jgi:hypothetical protein